MKILSYIFLFCFLSPAACSDKSTGPENGGPDSTADERTVVVNLTDDLRTFERSLDSLRITLDIPAFSATIVKGEKIVWAKGFGYADIENKVLASPFTSYHLASLTKTFASTIIMQLVEEGMFSLDDPVSQYGIQLESPGTIRVKHLFTHTSEGNPGTFYKYNGGRFGLLDNVIFSSSGKTFGSLLVENVIKPLDLKQTAPNVLDIQSFNLTGYDLIEYQKNLAAGYDRSGRNRLAYPSYFGVSAGLLSSALDVAVYSIAIDENRFLKEETKESVFKRFISESGEKLPYGLGWFVQYINGEKFVWHYGYWTGNSSLIIKALEKDLTFVILANSDRLSSPFPGLGGNGDVTASSVANEFLNTFVSGNGELPDAEIIIK